MKQFLDDMIFAMCAGLSFLGLFALFMFVAYELGFVHVTHIQ